MTRHAVVEVIGKSEDSPLYSLEAKGVEESFLEREAIPLIEATRELGVSHVQYTRTLLWNGKIEGVKVKFRGYDKWYVTLSSVREYKRDHLRANKPRSYTLKIDPDLEERVREALDSLEISYDLVLSYRKGGGR